MTPQLRSEDPRRGYGLNEVPTVTLRPGLIELRRAGEIISAPAWFLTDGTVEGLIAVSKFTVRLYQDYVNCGILK